MLDYGKEPLLTPGAAAPRGPAPINEEWYRTQDVILTSNAVAERVVQELRLDRDPSLIAGAPGRDPDSVKMQAAAKLRERLAIEVLPRTRVVRLSVEHTDPRRAARIANAVVEAYLRKALEDRVSTTERALGWVREQIGATRQRLEQTDVEIQTVLEQREGPVLLPGDRQAALTDEIKRLTQLITEARLRHIELAARLARLKGAAQSDNPFDVRAAELDQSEEVKQLRSAYLALVLQQPDLEADRESRADDVRIGHKKLDVLWGRMQSSVSGVVRSAQAELGEVQQIEKELQASLDRANAAGRELQYQQLQYGRLARERDENETWLKALRERSSAVGLATASGVSDAKVIDPATPPVEPVRPRVLLGAAAGALAGLLLSLLASALLALRPLATPREIALQAPRADQAMPDPEL